MSKLVSSIKSTDKSFNSKIYKVKHLVDGKINTIYVFNVTGDIEITDDISLLGLLAKNVIFIANGYIEISNSVTVSGIYISTGNYVRMFSTSELTGRIISTDGFVGITNATINAP